VEIRERDEKKIAIKLGIPEYPMEVSRDFMII
jgi:hypothetical protein